MTPMDPPARIVQWVRCPECQKAHVAAHGTDALGTITCPCGQRFHWTDHLRPKPEESP